MEPICNLLKSKKEELNWSNRKISHMTYIDETVISKHLNGKRDVSIIDLEKYCKCFGLNYEEIKASYTLEAIDICNKGTLKKIVASTAALGVGSLTYVAVKKLIDNNCNSLK